MNSASKWMSVPIIALAMMGSTHVSANSELARLSQDPANWAMQAGNFANHRYSELKQINNTNVGKLKVAWTMSTGVLRGHEGSPLVIGDMMYLHLSLIHI